MKLGKFIGKKSLRFTAEDINKLVEVVSMGCKANFDGKLNIIYPDGDDNLHTMTLEWILTNPIKKRMVRTGTVDFHGDYVYDITKFTFLAWKNEGYLADDPKRAPLISFDLKAYTDGSYHRYKHRKDNDFKFEGAGHYMYNTDLEDGQFIHDFNYWSNNIATNCIPS